jgi:PTH1 family peptidyl-tRNA hydrolase
MILVVGLGNIGEKYLNTRHNIGFKVIDALLEKFNTNEVKNSLFSGELHKDGEILFLKPSTYMNLSGKSVSSVSNFFKAEKIIVIHDDLDLPFGAIRFKVGGGTGGHNGLKSLQKAHQDEVIRVRMGIGKDSERDISSHVLSNFNIEENRCLDKWIELSRDAILKILESGSWEKVASLNSKKRAEEFC